MLDIDHFKEYNDTNGHLAGDYVIKTVADILKDNIRNKDLVARYGGEEFIIAILNPIVQQEAIIVAKRIKNKIKEYDFKSEEEQPGGKLTISIGISSLSSDKKLKMLIAEADNQLYNSKSKGRDCITIKQK